MKVSTEPASFAPRAHLPRAVAACALAVVCLAGCRDVACHRQPEVSPAAILDRMTIPPAAAQATERTVMRPKTLVVRTEAGDPLADVPVLTLADAVALGLQNNPRLQVAVANVMRADGEEVVAFSPFLPQLDLLSRVGATSSNLSPGAPGPVGGIIGTSLTEGHSYEQAELALQWMVHDFGRTRGRYRQAVSRQRIAQLQLTRAEQTVAFDVTAAYVTVLLAQTSRLVQEQAIRRAAAILDDTEARRKAGVLDRDDVLRAKVQLSESRSQLVTAQEGEFNAIARLNYALGRNAALPVQLIDWKTAPAFERSLVDCLQTAADQRQEVRVAQEAVAGAVAGVQVAEAEYLPRIYIRADVGHVDGGAIRTGWQSGAGIHLDQKIYAGRRRQGEEQAAAAEVRAAAANAQAVFDTISLEVSLAYRGQRATFERIALAEPAVREARENLRLVRVKYKNGNATPTDVVDAETTATRSEQRYFSAIYDHLTALARLEYAMGSAPGCALAPAPATDGELLPPPRILPDQDE